MNSWQNWMEGRDGHLEVYDLVIKLLDLKGKPLAGWLCRHAYPIKWQLEALDSVGSALSCETITETEVSDEIIRKIESRVLDRLSEENITGQPAGRRQTKRRNER